MPDADRVSPDASRYAKNRTRGQQIGHDTTERASLLRGELLSAAGQRTGITAGLDHERVLIMPMGDRERLLLVHRLTADLLGGHVARLVDRLVTTGDFDFRLAVLRGTALSNDMATKAEVAVSDELPARVLDALLLMPARTADGVVRGYRAYLDKVWRVPERRQVPTVDLVSRLLVGLEAAETRGAAVAVAVIYQAHLAETGTSNEALYSEQLALMTAFVGADAMSFRHGRLVIPQV